MGKTKIKDMDNKVGLGRLLRWQSSSISVSISALTVGFVSLYCTDALHLEPAIVGTMFMLSKIIDSITDFMAGFIIDRTQTKWGKGRPYEIFMVLLWLATWLLFSCPEGFTPVAKYIWIFFMYIFMNAICVTFLNGNNVVYMVRAFKTREQQTKVVAYGNFFTMAAAFIFNIAFLIAMTKIAVDAAGWSRLIGMIAIPLTLLGIIRVLTIKEQYNNESDNRKEKLKVKDIILLFKNNNSAVMLAVILIIINMSSGLGVGTYYWKYVVGNTALMSAASVVTIVGLPIAFALPVLRKKVGMRKMCIGGFFVQMVGFIIFGLAGANLPLVLVATLLTTVGGVPFSIMLNMFIVDCADYNEMNHAPRMEGTMGSVFGLSKKLGGAFGGFIGGLLLSAVHYSETLPMGIENSAAIAMIRVLSSLVPLLFYVAVVLLMRRYRLDEELKEWRTAKASAAEQEKAEN